jgi:CofD-related protein of GAK system
MIDASLTRREAKNRAERFLNAPESGPRIVFFSGGTALRGLSRVLPRYTRNSAHLVTPFDSGGSSAELRRVFGMPAVGDARNRLMALADRGMPGGRELVALLSRRLPADIPARELQDAFSRIAGGRDPLAAAVPEPLRGEILSCLETFARAMRRTDFNLGGASVGNLALAGAYFESGRSLGRALERFARLTRAGGAVLPIVEDGLDLVSELEDGTALMGQHLLTGKQSPPIASPVRRVYLGRAARGPERAGTSIGPAPAGAAISPEVAGIIRSADMICYPMGSFYSSLVANLLPSGVAGAVLEARCPKVFVPNPSGDPEQLGMGLGASVRRLAGYLLPDAVRPASGGGTTGVLDTLLLDRGLGYAAPLGLDAVRGMGVKIVEAELALPGEPALFDGLSVAEALLTLL